MKRRQVGEVLVAAALILGVGRVALAVDEPRPDGLDCDSFQEIPKARCDHWKAYNAGGRWWCHWDLKRGSLDGVWGHRGQPLSPGLDLTRITTARARSDTATRELLEAYARQQIRQHEQLFGFKPHGYELELTGFARRPAGARVIVLDDGTTRVETLPPVSVIRVRQIIDQKPLEDATIELQVDDDNRLVSFFSSFLGEVPANVPKHTLTQDDAVQVAIAEVAPGLTASPEDRVSAIPSFSIVGDMVRPTFQVFLSMPPLEDRPEVVEKLVLVDGTTGAVIEVLETADAHAVNGFTDGEGSGFLGDHPPFESAFTTPAGFAHVNTPEEFSQGVVTVALPHLRIPDPDLPCCDRFRLTGHFVDVGNRRVDQGLQDPWENTEPRFFLPNPFDAMLVDHEPFDADLTAAGAEGCAGVAGSPPFPIARGEENVLWESRMDEVSAYRNVDAAAEYFSSRFGYELSRSSAASPTLNVEVNRNTRRFPAYFSSQTTFLGSSPVIRFDNAFCWRIVAGGDNTFIGAIPGAATVDLYSIVDLSRDRDMSMHEFTHAITWDIAGIGERRYSKPFKEGIADFFPVSSRFDFTAPPPTGQPRFSEWFTRTNLDPPVDPATPYTELDDPEEHNVGRVWSTFLWDLRRRAHLFQTELNSPRITQHSIEDLQFEALFRMEPGSRPSPSRCASSSRRTRNGSERPSTTRS